MDDEEFIDNSSQVTIREKTFLEAILLVQYIDWNTMNDLIYIKRSC